MAGFVTGRGGRDLVERAGWQDARAFYAERRIGARVGFGRRPAVVVVDLSRGFTEARSPLGADLDDVVAATGQLLAAARKRGLPVFFTTVAYQADFSDGGWFVEKVPALKVLVRGSPWTDIDPRLAPQPGEPVLVKPYASAFFATDLQERLQRLSVDTLMLAGATTSGCVRATAVDGLQHGYRVIVPEECVGDRHPLPHQANLFDIDSKYGDVISLAEVTAYLGGDHVTGPP